MALVSFDCAVVLSATKHVIVLYGGAFLSGFLSVATGIDSILKHNKTSHHGPCVAWVYASAFLSEHRNTSIYLRCIYPSTGAQWCLYNPGSPLMHS